MPDKKHRKDDDSHQQHGLRPFWSGTITFGLVSLPVSLFGATRAKRVALRMIDHDGEPLARRYFCPKEEVALEADEIVRGYEVEKNKFVIVSEKELDSVAPEKSQEIDLRRFVPVDDIDPMFFQRAYFLAPDQGGVKPYRLLAKSMEDTQRAGIATCVIRGKEYLLAILAHQGILRAEILRFADELRSPDDIGLPAINKTKKTDVERIEKSINANSRKTLDRDELLDERAARMLDRVEQKLKDDEDVIRDIEDDDHEEPADLMAVLKQSLGQKEGRGSGREKKKSQSKQATGSKKKQGRGKKDSKTDEQAETDMTRDELYAKAKKIGVTGRSRMTKAELVDAIERT